MNFSCRVRGHQFNAERIPYWHSHERCQRCDELVVTPEWRNPASRFSHYTHVIKGSVPPRGDTAIDESDFFVAKHWPPAYIVMRAEMDGADLTVLRAAVLRSVREALGAMGIEVVEERA